VDFYLKSCALDNRELVFSGPRLTCVACAYLYLMDLVGKMEFSASTKYQVVRSVPWGCESDGVQVGLHEVIKVVNNRGYPLGGSESHHLLSLGLGKTVVYRQSRIY
jgi:hypothetical protein